MEHLPGLRTGLFSKLTAATTLAATPPPKPLSLHNDGVVILFCCFVPAHDEADFYVLYTLLLFSWLSDRLNLCWLNPNWAEFHDKSAYVAKLIKYKQQINLNRPSWTALASNA